MRIEKSLRNRLGLHLRALPVTKNLQFVVLVFICVFFAVLTLVYFSSSFTSAARAYVQGEGTWSKNQKQATIRLQEYSTSHDEKDYQPFLDSLSVQLGDRIAREQLEKPEPDYAAIHAGFQQLIISTGARELERDSNGGQLAVIPGRYAEICVQDSGSGIDPETVRHIFEPFFTTKDKDKGTGLGLSTVYGIVKRSGGYILVSSELGIGTAMRIYLPQVQGEVEGTSPDLDAAREMQGTGTVLIAEDEDSLRELIASRMRAESYEVLEAADGEIALAIASRHQGEIQFLLTDVIMPKLRGPELASLLRVRYPQMKVIYMSGYTESALVQDGMLQRNTALLQKPFPTSKIPEIIRQMNASVHG
jgi:CheY-like chemotaxis protein